MAFLGHLERASASFFAIPAAFPAAGCLSLGEALLKVSIALLGDDILLPVQYPVLVLIEFIKGRPRRDDVLMVPPEKEALNGLG